MFDIESLVANIDLQKLEDYRFRGLSLDVPLPRVFGGQVLAQALRAATHTVDPTRVAHSMHAYFLRPGDLKREIIYEVDPIRNGGSFSTRRVVATQRGRPIFSTTVSFQVREDGFEHQIDMPAGVPEPESLENDADRDRRLGTKYKQFRARIPADTIDFRSVNPRAEKQLTAMEPVNGYWFRFQDKIADDPGMHQSLLAYVSDLGLMSTGIRPHYEKLDLKRFQGASLDHSLWFHCDFRVDEWLYYHMESPRAAHGRNFNRGSFYNREGALVASSVQEGLMRLRVIPKKKTAEASS